MSQTQVRPKFDGKRRVRLEHPTEGGSNRSRFGERQYVTRADLTAIVQGTALAEKFTVDDNDLQAGLHKVVGACSANNTAAHNKDGLSRIVPVDIPVRKGSLESKNRVPSPVT